MAYPTKKKFVPKKKESKFRRYARKGRKVLKTTAQVAADVARLSAAVAYMGSRLNVEKKHLDYDVLTSSCGQTYGLADGISMIDVTPVIVQGVNSGQRIGNSLKLTGMSFPVQFTGQPFCMAGRKIKMCLFRVTSADNGVGLTDVKNDYWDVNPLTGIVDMGSPKAYRNGNHDGITLIRSKVYTLPAPTIVQGGASGTILDDYEKAGFTAKFNVKLNDILRYANGAETTPDGTRYYLYIFCDRGNNHPSTVSTADVPVPEVQTGVSFRLGQRAWWVDN